MIEGDSGRIRETDIHLLGFGSPDDHAELGVETMSGTFDHTETAGVSNILQFSYSFFIENDLNVDLSETIGFRIDLADLQPDAGGYLQMSARIADSSGVISESGLVFEAEPGPHSVLLPFADFDAAGVVNLADIGAIEISLYATPGTDFANALFTARGALADDGEAGPPRPRAVLVVSDGEDHEGRVGEAIDALRDEGVLLLAAGVGTEEGAPIPIYRNGQRVGFKTDRNGAQIMSRLEEGVLREIAGRDGLVRLGGGTGLAEISSRLDRLDRAVLDTERYEASAERFQWPLALGLLLLLAERLMVLRAIKSPENP